MAQAPAAIGSGPREIAPIRFGAIVFLASELVFFGGLFAAYFTLRSQTNPWPPSRVELDVARPSVATSLLVLSSFTFVAGLRGARAGRLASLSRWIVVTIFLALAFLGLQLLDWVQAGFSVSSHAYGTMVYAMTGFHGLHVIAGVLLMLVILGRMAQGAYGDGIIDGPEAVGYYWHFVDVVWIGLYTTIFLLR
ncbi:MAG TPA: cytochrome c oxidase subunit 3 [Actinomycetota bacterium]|jgi:cytochrome c oxidase subunit III